MAVSVVIPLFNKAPYVRRAVESVLRQTMTDFECIVIDDGSTDGSGDIVRGIDDPRIRLVRQANGGVSSARNNGLELARYPLIAFLDADDEWKPSFLSTSFEMHRQNPGIVASFTNFRCAGAARTAFHREQQGSRILLDYFAFCLANGGLGMCSSAIMIRRDVLSLIGGFPLDRNMGEDLDTWARLAWSGSVGFIAAELATYHNGEGVCAQSDRNLKRGMVAWGCDIHETYIAWFTRGLVPSTLAKSSVEYVYFLRLVDFHTAIRRKRVEQARLLYAGIPLRHRFSAMGLCGFFALRLPSCFHSLLGLGRRIEVWLLSWRWSEKKQGCCPRAAVAPSDCAGCCGARPAAPDPTDG